MSITIIEAIESQKQGVALFGHGAKLYGRVENGEGSQPCFHLPPGRRIPQYLPARKHLLGY